MEEEMKGFRGWGEGSWIVEGVLGMFTYRAGKIKLVIQQTSSTSAG